MKGAKSAILFAGLKDHLHSAQVAETRARVLLAEGRVVDVERAARRAVQTLETGDATWVMAEALTAQTALARLCHYAETRSTFERAISVAEQAGDTQRAALPKRR